MSKIEEFQKWAKQFIAIHDSHVREFLDSIGDLSLHKMKCLFSERYQKEISFSYSVQVERKGEGANRATFYYILQEKEIVKDLHLKKINEFHYSFCGTYGFCRASRKPSCGYGFGEYGDPSGRFGLLVRDIYVYESYRCVPSNECASGIGSYYIRDTKEKCKLDDGSDMGHYFSKSFFECNKDGSGKSHDYNSRSFGSKIAVKKDKWQWF